MSEDRRLEERLKGFLVSVEPTGVWEAIENRAKKEETPPGEGLPASREAPEERPAIRVTAVAREAPAQKRPRSLRLAAYACVAMVLVAGAAVGTLEAVEHLGKGPDILVIGDDTAGISPGSTGQGAQTTSPTQPVTTAGTAGEAPEAGQGAVSREVKATLQQWLEANNAGDINTLWALYAENAMVDDFVASPPTRTEGRAHVVGMIAYWAREGLAFTASGEPVRFGDYVAQAVIITGDGVPMGEAVHVFELDMDGKIAHHWVTGEIRAD
ncbi:MAG: hypothetical protein A2133_00710 [Actinobacteria bacterium RBG_16_64_13]|nr:MAG: hypothetical protein A2133_00710 [Actinobacteria bacterium RBG_16_64_13]